MASGVQLKSPGARIDNRLAIACAAALARAHEFTAAESLLRDLQHEPSALDLLARIHVQNGNSASAQDCWQKALSLSPELSSATSALKALERKDHWLSLRYRYPLLLAILTFGFVVPLLVLGGFFWKANRHPSIPPLPPALPAIAEVPRAPAVRTVALRDPLFTSGTRISSQGRNELIRIAEGLRPVSTDRIEVIGRADRIPLKRGSGFRSNRDLAILRAATAAQLLERRGVDHSRISLRYEVATLDSREPDRNWRTVVIRVIETGAKN